MSIPGYQPSDTAEFALEFGSARAAVVASDVPDEFGVDDSVHSSPADAHAHAHALSEPVDLVGLDGLDGVSAMRIEVGYDPAGLPPGASPTDVAVAVKTETGWETLDSTVDLAETTVTAVLNDRPPGSRIVAVYDDGER
ncbi:hypothetical protein C482_04936 [Natrialba chahannaoensis JCM 10990]|uniref:Uncharacterized protein n=1 Tax=Natrialba chahannaoensis JCM 10990 TaxID=1227492 RepID=M0AZV9_9EURY|nr:hypothetical protein [Natrialba chahannaoensis]ELZ02974.1 hypothetical protein C482_04936 [Natrialba chahannaoensis JCM 10990]